jgi:hypothetical protein
MPILQVCIKLLSFAIVDEFKLEKARKIQAGTLPVRSRKPESAS